MKEETKEAFEARNEIVKFAGVISLKSYEVVDL